MKVTKGPTIAIFRAFVLLTALDIWKNLDPIRKELEIKNISWSPLDWSKEVWGYQLVVFCLIGMLGLALGGIPTVEDE
jgi:hypothetical protein